MTILEIIEKIAPEIQENEHIRAMWIEGSYATGKFNEKSDIDIWLDVDDGTFDECFDFFEQALRNTVELERIENRGTYSDDPKLAKKTFYLKGFPEGQTIELDLQEHSRNFKFSKSVHQIKVLFDKNSTIQWIK